VQNATFVSSADRKATRSAGELGNVSGRFSFLRASLCAGSPIVIVFLTLATLLIGQRLSQADEPVKLAMVSHSTTASTNATKAAPKATTTDTNSFSASFQQHPVTTSLPVATTVRPLDNPQPLVPVAALIKKRPAPAGLFSGQPGNGNFGFANIEAGYGQAYECDSVVLRGRNGTQYEETRYIFFKKVVKF
jgi:hypothetical protein